MASRMDRYYKSSNSSMERSRKNKDLYKKVHNESRSGIDSIASISRANEIDISKIKDIVSDRESFKKERKLKESIGNSGLNIDIPSKKSSDDNYDIMDIKPEKISVGEEKEVVKNYDLSDVLNKAMDEYNEDDSKNRNLKNLEYTDLNSLNLHKKEYKNSELELKDMIKSIHNTSNLNKIGDDALLLDSLKSDTMVGDSSIKKVLEQDKEEEQKDSTKELDKSFFTNTFDFADEDFDELLARKKGKKKKIIIAIIICLLVAGVICALYFTGIINFNKH
ncbi:MAG: hypothetical protein IJ094_10490 [Bacilli bacterium]|nr:hypothetical protein [Bacilli bacterium]